MCLPHPHNYPLHPFLPVYTRFVCCFTRNTLSTLLQKIMHFQSKTNFFFQLIAGQFSFYCFDVFLGALFLSSTINSFILACIYSFLLDLSSNHVAESMGMVWKLQAVVVFLISKETKIKVDTTSIILSYLYYFGNVNKELFRYC